ncbi:MAG: hypothetical protein N2484_14100 [Clostridia bacterium]|nr:hypothetical protein [Clostridia bacterium]
MIRRGMSILILGIFLALSFSNTSFAQSNATGTKKAKKKPFEYSEKSSSVEMNSKVNLNTTPYTLIIVPPPEIHDQIAVKIPKIHDPIEVNPLKNK